MILSLRGRDGQTLRLAVTASLPRVRPCWGGHMVSAKERAVTPPAPEDFASVVKTNMQYIEEVLQG